MRQYLHQEPSDDIDEFAKQAGQALALEERFGLIVSRAIARAYNGDK